MNDDVRLWTLEAVLDDWISDLDMQGDYQSEGHLERPDAYDAMVRQAVEWIRRGVLVPGQMLENGFVPWPEPPAESAERFASLAAGLTEIDLPGDICWFDTGPAAADEFASLSA